MSDEEMKYWCALNTLGKYNGCGENIASSTDPVIKEDVRQALEIKKAYEIER